MALAVILFAGFIGLALATSLAVLASVEVALSAWEALQRAGRNARQAAVLEPQRIADGVPALLQSGVHQWAQSA